MNVCFCWRYKPSFPPPPLEDSPVAKWWESGGGKGNYWAWGWAGTGGGLWGPNVCTYTNVRRELSAYRAMLG